MRHCFVATLANHRGGPMLARCQTGCNDKLRGRGATAPVPQLRGLRRSSSGARTRNQKAVLEHQSLCSITKSIIGNFEMHICNKKARSVFRRYCCGNALDTTVGTLLSHSRPARNSYRGPRRRSTTYQRVSRTRAKARSGTGLPIASSPISSIIACVGLRRRGAESGR